jgi:DegV family protein with EDD domain
MSVAVVTDTTSYLPHEMIERDGIEVVDLYIVFEGERTERESSITDYPAFFEELRSAETLPTTSQPSVGDFMSTYEPLLAAGKDIVSIHISAGLSGTADSARQAAQSLDDGGRIKVIDSTTAAGGLGILVLTAAHAAEKGASADEIEQLVAEAREDLKMWFAIDTLEFLKRGGRIGAASAWIGSTLKVKPILTVESEMTPVERVRTSKRMFERMVDYARQRHESGRDAWVVQHIAAPEEAAELADRCREIFGNDPLFVSEIGPVLSAHTGPGLLGVGSISERFFD